MTPMTLDWGAEQLKKVVPMRWRRRIAWGRVAVRQLTARFRPLPNVLIIGAQRCGTSSLYKYLGRHPEAAASLRKETQYFTAFSARGERWYRAHFPLATPLTGGRAKVCFEATPDYLLDRRCAARAAAALPGAWIVALLRDPVQRAFSHYQHVRRLGGEPLSFEDALDQEEARLSEHAGMMARCPDRPMPQTYRRFSYATRGLYAEQLACWLACFPAERVLVIASEDFFRDPARVFNHLTSVLGLSPWIPAAFTNYSYSRNAGSQLRGESMAPATRARLAARFRQPNEDLYHLLGRRFDW